jgi:hypothetical protein
MKTNVKVIIFGLGCITALEAFAMYRGFDGVLLTTVIAVIAAGIGITIPTPEFMKIK